MNKTQNGTNVKNLEKRADRIIDVVKGVHSSRVNYVSFSHFNEQFRGNT